MIHFWDQLAIYGDVMDHDFYFKISFDDFLIEYYLVGKIHPHI
jgi:hypothetical protein